MLELEKCRQCNGVGKLLFRNLKAIDCDMCEGTGMSSKNLFWIITGKLLHEYRIKNELTIYDISELFNLDPSNISKMERGILKPNSEYLKTALGNN